MPVINNQPGNVLATKPLTGTDETAAGVTGQSNTGPGILGQSLGLEPPLIIGGPVGIPRPASDGVMGIGTNGVHGQSASATNNGVWGENTGAGFGVSGTSVSGVGILGRSTTGNAGQFEGNVLVTGHVTTSDVILSGADCAEEFDAPHAGDIEAGAVVVFDENGKLDLSRRPYDKRVAGVISGAGPFRPGLVLDRQVTSHPRLPVALSGKVYCKVDASFGAIELGDMLTTSTSAGCAMKAQDPSRVRSYHR